MLLLCYFAMLFVPIEKHVFEYSRLTDLNVDKYSFKQ